MLIFLMFIIMIAFVGLKAAKPGEFFDNYMSKENTTAINGIFVLLIFLSHAEGYVTSDGILDTAYLTFKDNMLQLIVVSFLFYSGYGIMESIKAKGQAYVRSIPAKRFFKVYYRLFLCVCLFLALNLIIKKNYGLKTTLLAFTGWTGIGNSNWYIFAILVLYVFVFISFMIFGKRHWLGVILTTLLSAVYVVFQMKLGRKGWNYNTIMLFPTGMIFSMIKEPIENIIKRNDALWVLSVGILFPGFSYLHCLYPKNIITYSLWAILFMVILVLITMKVQISNPILSWFGSHVFGMYMLQRIPMNLLSHFGFAESHKYAFIAVSFAATVILSYFFELLTGKIDGLIFKRASAKPEKAA